MPTTLLASRSTPMRAHCPTCGRELQVVEIVEVVVHTAEQAKKVQALLQVTLNLISLGTLQL
jgi:4-hydroxy-3-methylbut-2-en-1-yl diphosphate synthase IspG/GcpE